MIGISFLVKSSTTSHVPICVWTPFVRVIKLCRNPVLSFFYIVPPFSFYLVLLFFLLPYLSFSTWIAIDTTAAKEIHFSSDRFCKALTCVDGKRRSKTSFFRYCYLSKFSFKHEWLLTTFVWIIFQIVIWGENMDWIETVIS